MNVTVDDNAVDPSTGNGILYFSQSQWQLLDDSVLSHPDDTDWYDDTVHYTQSRSPATEQSPGGRAQFSFNGTDVYIYGVRWRYLYQNMTLSVDGVVVDSFFSIPDTISLQVEDHVLFMQAHFPPGPHTIVVENVGVDDGGISDGSVLALDRIIYTTGDGRSHKTLPTGAIIGIVVGAVGFMVIAVICVLYRKKISFTRGFSRAPRIGVLRYTNVRSSTDESHEYKPLDP
ncbi:hypothetical protein NP233_g7363 [Leucocoprinus birnbaumii]|uniref:Transmembrane protein n=1 Tax=Leucocoprinus birnbaumii TaxID=56174 RepID=A0AAD5VQC2_9AGAR|nr:hypothetical protein NP233_g7363 [Leucocoprinus birnbaumii]